MKKTSEELQKRVKELSKSNKIIEITRLTGLTRHTIRKILRDRYKEYRKTKVSVDLFKDITNRELNYLLGILATDGCITSNRIELSLKEVDGELIDKIVTFLGNCINSRVKSKNLNNKIFYSKAISFRSKEISEILYSYGITPRKSFTLDYKLPITWDFMRGVIDGDGSIFKTSQGRCIIHLISCSEIFIDQIASFLTINNIQYRKNVDKVKYFQLRISKSTEVLKTINNLYDNTHINSLYLQRKYVTAHLVRNYLECKLSNSGN